MFATGLGFAGVAAFLAAAGRRVRRHAESVRRRRRACSCRRSRRCSRRTSRGGSHRAVRALQPRRHLLGALGALASGLPVLVARPRMAARRAAATASCSTAPSRSCIGALYLGLRSGARRAPRRPAARHSSSARASVLRLTALFALDSLRRRLRRRLAGRALAVPALRSARSRRRARSSSRARVLAAFSQLVSSWLARAHRTGRARWSSRTCRPNVFLIARRVHADRAARDRLPARAHGALADGRAGAAVVRDGRRAAGGARRGRQRDERAAQPRRRRCRPSARRRDARSTRRFGWPLVIGGTLKIVYDLLLLFLFRRLRPAEET